MADCILLIVDGQHWALIGGERRPRIPNGDGVVLVDAHHFIATWRKLERQCFIRSFRKEGHHYEILEKGAIGDGVDPHDVLVRNGNHPMLVRKPDGISCSQVNGPILPLH